MNLAGEEELTGPEDLKTASRQHLPFPPKTILQEVLLQRSWKQIHLLPLWMRVQSLALLSGLRIRHCHELWFRVTDTARIWRGCGCGVGLQLQL